MPTINPDPKVPEIIRAAETAFREPGADLARLYRAIDACPSSTHADVALITWFYLYHYGRSPLDVRPSRGYTYRVRMRAGECRVRTVDSFDHREGVVVLRSA